MEKIMQNIPTETSPSLLMLISHLLSFDKCNLGTVMKTKQIMLRQCT